MKCRILGDWSFCDGPKPLGVAGLTRLCCGKAGVPHNRVLDDATDGGENAPPEAQEEEQANTP